jgi:hypothetical protein
MSSDSSSITQGIERKFLNACHLTSIEVRWQALILFAGINLLATCRDVSRRLFLADGSSRQCGVGTSDFELESIALDGCFDVV